MDYKKAYTDLCNSRRELRPVSTKRKIGYETHHIIPKCLGGNDKTFNLVHLTPREHFLAHWLLTKIYPQHQGLNCAFFLMCHSDKYKDTKLNSKSHARLRESYRAIRIGSNNPQYGKPGTMTGIKGEAHPRYGKEVSDQTKKLISEANKGQTRNAQVRERMKESQRKFIYITPKGEFPNLELAAKAFEVTIQCMSDWVRNPKKTCFYKISKVDKPN